MNERMKPHVFRLRPGDRLLEGLVSYIEKAGIKAACVLTCVGSLTEAHLRLASGQTTRHFTGPFEICSLVGTFSPDGPHLHIALSDEEGRMLGGHLLPGCVIYTTAEVALAELGEMRFTRLFDPETGFGELVVEH